MNAAEPNLQPILLDQLPASEKPRRQSSETPIPELIRLTPPAAFSALVREIASQSTH